jgi:hypothetical protein
MTTSTRKKSFQTIQSNSVQNSLVTQNLELFISDLDEQIIKLKDIQLELESLRVDIQLQSLDFELDLTLLDFEI